MSRPALIQIPERISSTRALEQLIEKDSEEKKTYEKEIQSRRKKIKAKASFDAEYWAGHKEVTELELKRHVLLHKISRNSFLAQGGKEELWEKEEKSKTLREEKSALELKNQILAKHIERMTSSQDDKDRAHRKWVMELLTTTPNSKGGMGMGGIVGQGRRSTAEQSAFRERLENVCNSRHPDEDFNQQWCPILGAWTPTKYMRAAHIFPYGAGQTAMDELFGRNADNREELMEPENGLMMCEDAVKKIADGGIVLVPDVPNDASAEELGTWTNAAVKEYKLRVLCPASKSMQEVLPFISSVKEDKTDRPRWYSLEGKRVECRSDHRPRARYLYWQFAVALLRQAWQTNHRANNPVAAEFGKQFWGTKGSWIKRKYLLAFTEYLGHAVEWDNLLEAATEPENEEDDKPDPAGLVLASTQITSMRKRTAEGWENEEEDEEEDEEESDIEEDSLD